MQQHDEEGVVIDGDTEAHGDEMNLAMMGFKHICVSLPCLCPLLCTTTLDIGH